MVVSIWCIVCLAVAFNTFMFWESVKGLWRWHDQRLEREIRGRLRGKHNFLVPKEEWDA